MLIVAREPVEPRGAQRRRRQRGLLDHLHEIAEHGALGAARGLHLLLQLRLVVRGVRGAHHDDAELLVIVDAGDGVGRRQHVLIEEVAEREIFGIVVDGHRGDDLLRIEEDRQRALDRHRGLDRRAGLVDAAHPLGEPRVERIGAQEIVVVSHCAWTMWISGKLCKAARRGLAVPRRRRRPALPRGRQGFGVQGKSGSTAAPRQRLPAPARRL